jgi:hypothetical protein
MRICRASMVMVALLTVVPVDAGQICIGCPVQKLEKTRIQDGDWNLELVLGPGVSKPDAELIVRAARANKITDKFNDVRQNGWTAIDIARVYAIYTSTYFSASTPWLGIAENGVRYFELLEPASSPVSSWHHVVGLRGDGRLERVAVIHAQAY